MIVLEQPKSGDILDATRTTHPTLLELRTGKHTVSDKESTLYGYVLNGRTDIKTSGFQFRGDPGTFFCVPGECELNANGLVVLISRPGYKGLLTAGRVESTGRLPYLSGCSATVLVAPPKLGDPVLNHLHIPEAIDQSQHTHPSIRLGIVVRGCGIARGHDPATPTEWTKPLVQGSVFLLDAGEWHGFSTKANSSGLDLITYHPDSDWGPTDDNHPMLSATEISTDRPDNKVVPPDEVLR
jgi:hypothetical protein